MTDYFNRKQIPKPKFPQKNKMSYTFFMGREDKVDKALALLKDHNFIVEQVDSLGRIMR